MVKNPSANAGDAGDVGTIPESGRSPGENNGKPLQDDMENPMDRGAWQATVQELDMYRAHTRGARSRGSHSKEGICGSLWEGAISAHLIQCQDTKGVSVGPSGKVLYLPT